MRICACSEQMATQFCKNVVVGSLFITGIAVMTIAAVFFTNGFPASLSLAARLGGGTPLAFVGVSLCSVAVGVKRGC